MFNELKLSIINFITGANVAGLNTQWIYNFEPTQPAGFPAISVTPWSVTGKFADTQRIRRDFTLRIRVYQERQTVGTQSAILTSQQEAERIITTLVDNLTQVFDNYQNYKLDNTVPGLVFVTPVPVEWGYSQAPNMDMRIADIKLVAVVMQ